MNKSESGRISSIILIYPQDLDLHSITDKLNNIEPSIKFTCELEYNSILPFLDILLIRNIKLKFKVYHKPTCKNDHFHFNSAKILIYIHNKSLRQIFEAAAISFSNSLNTRPGFYHISHYLNGSLLNSYTIFHL